MNLDLFTNLHRKGLISDASLQRIKVLAQNRLFSVHWELRSLLYLGVLLLTGGLGILVYKNIDTIGHTAIVIFIAVVCVSGFAYCFARRTAFSRQQQASPTVFFDYVLLLACLSFVIWIGYMQYQYRLFGTRFGLAAFIPMAVLFFSAYYFDHLGVLSLAITNFCAWAGIAVTPTRILVDNDFNSDHLIYTGIGVAIGLVIVAAVLRREQFKVHFAFTHIHFGLHLFFICALAAQFRFHLYAVWFLVVMVGAVYFYFEALRSRSFFLLLMSTLYAYVGLCGFFGEFLFNLGSGDMISLFLLTLIGSTIGLIFYLVKMNKKIRSL